MVTQQSPRIKVPPLPKGQRATIGMGLVIVGLLALVGNWLRSDLIGLLFLPAIGVTFLAWGVARRNTGFFTAGGVISGIGFGIFAQQNFYPTADPTGVLLLSIGLGLLSIWLFSGFHSIAPQRWVLLPGGILAILGIAYLTQGTVHDAVTFISSIWPVLLVLLGVYFLWEASRAKSPPPTSI